LTSTSPMKSCSPSLSPSKRRKGRLAAHSDSPKHRMPPAPSLPVQEIGWISRRGGGEQASMRRPA
jgi:hypothetical protein